eukprot:77201-Ditylum_brightwellii.AAC.1
MMLLFIYLYSIIVDDDDGDAVHCIVVGYIIGIVDDAVAIDFIVIESIIVLGDGGVDYIAIDNFDVGDDDDGDGGDIDHIAVVDSDDVVDNTAVDTIAADNIVVVNVDDDDDDDAIDYIVVDYIVVAVDDDDVDDD